MASCGEGAGAGSAAHRALLDRCAPRKALVGTRSSSACAIWVMGQSDHRLHPGVRRRPRRAMEGNDPRGGRREAGVVGRHWSSRGAQSSGSIRRYRLRVDVFGGRSSGPRPRSRAGSAAGWSIYRSDDDGPAARRQRVDLLVKRCRCSPERSCRRPEVVAPLPREALPWRTNASLAASLGAALEIGQAVAPDGIERAIAEAAAAAVGGLLISFDAPYHAHRQEIVDATQLHRMSAIYGAREPEKLLGRRRTRHKQRPLRWQPSWPAGHFGVAMRRICLSSNPQNSN